MRILQGYRAYNQSSTKSSCILKMTSTYPFRFRWDYDGETYTVPYQNVIHIKARYNKKRFLGTSPDIELKRSLDLVETSGEIVKNIVNRSNSLTGYLKYNNLADDKELKQIAKDFQDAYMGAENAGALPQ